MPADSRSRICEPSDQQDRRNSRLFQSIGTTGQNLRQKHATRRQIVNRRSALKIKLKKKRRIAPPLSQNKPCEKIIRWQLLQP
ncbi:hypothetical protein P7D07_29825, partial [Bacillus cereus]|nr:hypothetical protein [Bacillus cereus]